MKMPNICCCELHVMTIWFPTNSEKQFLGFASLKDKIDARYSLLWTPCWALPFSGLFRETVSGHFEIYKPCRCPFFFLVNAPLSPSDFSQFQRNDFWASQAEKSISMPRFHCCEHSVKFISLQGFGDRKVLSYMGSDHKDVAGSSSKRIPFH